MSQPSLPNRLSYLRPFISELLRLDEDAIDESIDNTALLVALKDRAATEPHSTAVQALTEDKAELERWLASQPDHPAQFVLGFFSEPAELVRHLESFKPPKGWIAKPARKPKARKQIQMEIPPGFSFRREGSGFFIQMGETIGTRTCVGVGFDKGPSLQALKNFASQESDVSFEAAKFGSLTGTRVLRDGRTVTMLLRDRGVKYCVYFEGNSELVEPYLHTLSVTESEI